MDADSIPFYNQPEGNRFKDRSRNCGWNCEQADLNKCKLFNWKKRSASRDRWKSP